MAKVIVLKPTKTLQNRITGAFIFTTFTISILYGLLVFNAMKHTEDDILNQRLLLEAQYFIEQFVKDPVTARLPNSIGFKGYLSSSPDLPTLLRNQPLGTRELHNEELHVGVMEIPGSDQLLYLSLSELDSSNLEQELSSLFIILLSVGTLITVVGLIIGLLFSNSIAKPIAQLTKDVESCDMKKSTPFYGADRGDEVGALSKSFTDLVHRLHGFLQREKEFTQYASHELRTPISLMKNALAILRLPEQNDERKNRNLGRIESATIELESLINTFLTLGREEVINKEEIDIIDILKKNIERNKLINENKKMDIQIAIESEPEKLMSNKNLVDILIDNIVRNIYAHGISKANILVNSHAIVFKNNIPTYIVNSMTPKSHGYGKEIIDKLVERCGFKLKNTLTENNYIIELEFI